MLTILHTSHLAHSRCSTSIDEVGKWNCGACFTFPIAHLLYYRRSDGDKALLPYPFPLPAPRPPLPSVGLKDKEAPEVVLVPVLDHGGQRRVSVGAVRGKFLPKSSCTAGLPSPRCLHFLHQLFGATSPGSARTGFDGFFTACGLDARAEHMWRTSQGRGGVEGRHGGGAGARPQPLQNTGLPRA